MIILCQSPDCFFGRTLLWRRVEAFPSCVLSNKHDVILSRSWSHRQLKPRSRRGPRDKLTRPEGQTGEPTRPEGQTSSSLIANMQNGQSFCSLRAEFCFLIHGFILFTLSQVEHDVCLNIPTLHQTSSHPSCLRIEDVIWFGKQTYLLGFLIVRKP